MKVMCMKCGSEIQMDNPPNPQILNTGDISVIVANHAQRGFCLGCKLPVVVAVTSAHLQLSGMPVEPPQQASPILVVPGGALRKVR